MYRNGSREKSRLRQRMARPKKQISQDNLIRYVVDCSRYQFCSHTVIKDRGSRGFPPVAFTAVKVDYYGKEEGRSMCSRYGLENRLLQVIRAYYDCVLASPKTWTSIYGASATHQMMQLIVSTQMANRFDSNTLLILWFANPKSKSSEHWDRGHCKHAAEVISPNKRYYGRDNAWTASHHFMICVLSCFTDLSFPPSIPTLMNDDDTA